MSVSYPESEFIDNEMWVVKGEYWVEAGLTYGEPWGPNNDFFWADERPKYGYSQHNYPYANWQYNELYDDNIHYIGSSDWEVTIGPFAGKVSKESMAAPAYTLQTGLEVSSANGYHTFSSSSYMSYYTLGNVYTNYWDSRTGGAYLHVDTPLNASWLTGETYYKVEDWVGEIC
jgi:hypothetical protein